jgi:hypothetical protein
MAETLHPTATHHLPMFITPAGQTDVLMVVLAVLLFFVVILFGVFYFRLHSLPERIAHKTHKVQFELVAILGLISLFTHMHIFWIAGLLLAFIDLPDFGGPLGRIAGSVEKMAGSEPGESAPARAEDTVKHVGTATEAVPEIHGGRRGDGAPVDKTPVREKGLSHA